MVLDGIFPPGFSSLLIVNCIFLVCELLIWTKQDILGYILGLLGNCDQHLTQLSDTDKTTNRLPERKNNRQIDR